jgi:AbrB family looped-hinge helix DNA binding protein
MGRGGGRRKSIESLHSSYVVRCVQEELTMAAVMLSEKGQIVIPAEIRARYDLKPGTQVEFVDDGGTIRLVVLRRLAPSDPAAGYGMIKVERSATGPARKLSEFDPASLVRRRNPE